MVTCVDRLPEWPIRWGYGDIAPPLRMHDIYCSNNDRARHNLREQNTFLSDLCDVKISRVGVPLLPLSVRPHLEAKQGTILLAHQRLLLGT